MHTLSASHQKMPKCEKIAIFGIETDKLLLKSWETDKLQKFFEKYECPTLFSYQIEGISKKTFFDDFRAHYTGGGS